MKKLTTLLLAAGMTVAAAAPASAADIKVDGLYQFSYYRWQHAQNFTKNGADRNSDSMVQRVRIGLTAAVSENLSAYFQAQAKWQWGNGAVDDFGTSSFKEGAVGNGTKIYMRAAYLDWIIPGTTVKVRMGRQDLRLPQMPTGKNSIFWWKDAADGIAISSPVTDWLSLSGFWARLSRDGVKSEGKYGYVYSNGYDVDISSKVDVLALIADMKFDGFSITPFYAYASIGNKRQLEDAHNNAGLMANGQYGRGNANWIGFTSNLSMFDPLTFDFGAMWGIRNFNGGDVYYGGVKVTDNAKKQMGWTVEGKLAYKTPYGVPSLTMWYGSGDRNIKKGASRYIGHGMMPAIAGRNALSNTFFNGIGTVDANNNNYHGLQGTWGAKLAMSNISFLEDLTHEVAVVFAMGTNHAANIKYAKTGPNKYMTTKDRMIEFDLKNQYNIYKNLSLLVELGYVVEGFNDSKWGRDFSNGWRGAMQLDYKF